MRRANDVPCHKVLHYIFERRTQCNLHETRSTWHLSGYPTSQECISMQQRGSRPHEFLPLSHLKSFAAGNSPRRRVLHVFVKPAKHLVDKLFVRLYCRIPMRFMGEDHQSSGAAVASDRLV